jgi:hypothetical protein
MTTTYEVGRSSGTCAATGRALAVGEAFMAALVERQSDGRLERLDYSLDAWTGGARPGSGLQLVGTWRSVIRPAEAPRQRLIDDAELLDLFEQLGQSEGRQQLAFRFILALILIRKRLLRCVGSRPVPGGVGEVMLVHPTKAAGGSGEGPPVEVVDPGLDEQTIAEATEQLGAVMLGLDDGPAAQAS